MAADLWVSAGGHAPARASSPARRRADAFVSTRGRTAPPVTLAEAVRRGLAPDGGLYVPAAIPATDAPASGPALRGRPLPEVATALIAPLVADTFDARPARAAHGLGAAISRFRSCRLRRGVWVLELFHGPTLAFKDVGARSMARWLAATAAGGADARPLTVLVATSGDTGGAVAHAFHDVAGTRVVVLYPRGRVSPVQEAQFATLGGNVTAVAVEGTFDDCQRLVKEAFCRSRRSPARYRLTSANSINIGRLLPQMAYYAWAVLQLPADAPPPVVVVPSGNLGNRHRRAAGGRAAACRSRRFVAATTRERPAAALSRRRAATSRAPRCRRWPTRWTSAHPSNFERLLYFFDGDVEAMRAPMTGVTVTDDEIRAAMRELAAHGYVADPHTAVGWVGAQAAAASGADRGAARGAGHRASREVPRGRGAGARPRHPAAAGAGRAAGAPAAARSVAPPRPSPAGALAARARRPSDRPRAPAGTISA